MAEPDTLLTGTVSVASPLGYLPSNTSYPLPDPVQSVGQACVLERLVVRVERSAFWPTFQWVDAVLAGSCIESSVERQNIDSNQPLPFESVYL